MATLTAATVLGQARRVVIKIGSALLVEHGRLRENWLRSLAADVAVLRAGGADVVIVSSGSIALGRGALKLPDGALALEQSQAAASVGQIRLARAYEEALTPHQISTGQVLLTLDDTHDRRRYLNIRATLATLLGLGVVPIVNENDTIATDEIRYGDNDRLAAQVAVTIGADLLVLLSDVDGLYTGNPQTDPDVRHLAQVDLITPEIEAMAGAPTSSLSKGGMKTKVMAAKTAVAAGCAMVIAAGAAMHPLAQLTQGARATVFAAQGDPRSARKRWIAAMKPKGVLHVDAGAVQALGQGKSLLPAGVSRIEGQFQRGDPVAIMGPEGALGVGLAGYDSTEAAAIAGHHSREIAEILNYPGRVALIHRDEMAL
ncbi:glutamate 5-kinase [Roseinatronobacter sp.]|uniref:glutamate 5-kinase n=1 Tax=Roseinatronobacter sp. TaxID=1945755 RepID=UPI0025F68BE9|nr:glutamate 5-kinase [Rhodobaca sp.]